MKRLLLVLIPVAILFFAFFITNAKLYDFCNQKGEVSKLVDLGFVVEEYYGDNYKKYIINNRVVGECVQIKGDLKALDKICTKLGVDILKKYYVGDRFVIEGVSSKFAYLNGREQSNIQMAIDEGAITIGTPIIYGSY